MSLARFAKRRDANQRIIVEALEQHGAEVWIIDRPGDLLVWFRELWFIFETKTRYGRFTPRQLADRAAGKCRGIITVREPVEALKAIGSIP